MLQCVRDADKAFFSPKPKILYKLIPYFSKKDLTFDVKNQSTKYTN